MAFTVTSHYQGQEVIQQIERGVKANLMAAVLIWHGGVIRTLTGSRSGRTYRIPGTGRRYTASAPGQPPATRLGDLRTSYRFQVVDNYAEIGSPLVYALMLERGTRKMAPRPHIIPAYQESRAAIVAALEKNVI